MLVGRSLFIACPIGAEDSDERKRSDRVLKHVIVPVVEALEARPDDVLVRSDKIDSPGRITKQIIEHIANCDVLIADLTGANPNVMYELGLRQALLKPYVLLAEKGQKLPFDLSDFRTIFYQLDLDNVDSAQDELKAHLERALQGEVSVIDQELLGKRPDAAKGGAVPPAASSSNFEVLEACNRILSEASDIRDLLTSVGRLVLDLTKREQREFEQRKELQNQELGMTLFSQLLQNPDSIDKTLPLMKTLMEFGQEMQNETDTDVLPE